jgi:glycosyltransferase involved in cell wall biosynthesis
VNASEKVTVAVATYRRPADLAALLPMLVDHAREAATDGRSVDVLVVDNDPDGGGRDVAAGYAGDGVRYVLEAEPGIASARNRALDEAADSDVLVFIDDDERPHAGWLALLLETRERTAAQAVAGAVVSAFDGVLEPWVASGDFFSRRRLATGTEVTVAATNNLLLDLGVVRREGLRFDAAFGITGGSDTLFTRRLTAAGARMVWCDEAVVTDWVPAARMTRDWVLRRAFRSGNSASRVDLTLARTPAERARARGVAARRGVPRVVGGAGQFLLGWASRRSRHQARGLRTAARGAGMLAGAFGITYAEYRRTERRTAS